MHCLSVISRGKFAATACGSAARPHRSRRNRRHGSTGGRRWRARCIITVLSLGFALAAATSPASAQPASPADATGAARLVPATAATAAPVRVAAASSLRALWPRLMALAPDGLQATVSFGSSGNLTRQILQGAPYDLLLSASDVYVEKLRSAGRQPLTSRPYALGQLALVTRRADAGEPPVTLDTLGRALRAAPEGRPRRLSIANPAHAPYGQAAREVLRRADVWALAKRSLSLAENAAQTLQFVRAGAVWAALVPRSLLEGLPGRDQLHVAAIDPALHAPIRHVAVWLTPSHPAAGQLYELLGTEAARRLLRDAGFAVPSAQ